MLSSINLMFLISLAVTTWIILCYFKQIIQYQEAPEINVQFAMDTPIEDRITTSCYENYDLYLNFLCIFACIYVLAKVTQVTENFVTKHVHAKFQNKNIKFQPKTFEDYKIQYNNLITQIEQLENQNTELKLKLNEQHPANNSMDDGDDKIYYNSVGEKNRPNQIPNPHQQQSNVYISNRHFHLNRQVFVSDSNIKMKFEDLDPNESEVTCVWRKYFAMQQQQERQRQPRLNVFQLKAELINSAPTIVSTEELQGLYY